MEHVSEYEYLGNWLDHKFLINLLASKLKQKQKAVGKHRKLDNKKKKILLAVFLPVLDNGNIISLSHRWTQFIALHSDSLMVTVTLLSSPKR